MTAVVAEAVRAMEVQLQDEIERLETLRTINDHVRPEEIAAAQKQKADLHAALSAAHVRLDSLRLIFGVK
jgi:ATP-dependent helicase HepA